ncbi:MAG: HAMP domain-containing histidine kinase [Streptococcaceae bacterium]|jgi:signal transduction histidine kinase|nr:HAMP domain-containing histidine kinase [Streptococcaceae bacterium]
MNKIKNKATKVNQGMKERPKQSILRRWSFANAAFFFVVILIVALASYRIVLSTVNNLNKQGMIKAMDHLVVPLEKSSEVLTTNDLEKYFTINSKLEANAEGHIIHTPPVISEMISARNMSFYVFGANRQLIFSTLDKDFPFHADTDGKPVLINFKQSKGFLLSKTIRSNQTGQVIGYTIVYYNLDPFTSLAEQIFYSFSIVAVVGFIVASFFGYWLARRFIHPLRKITSSMEKVAAHPDEKFEPVFIEKDDEIAQIAKFYNNMMERIDYYIEQQRGFVSDVSHELRTPLAVIDGYLKLLQRWGKEDPEVLEESLNISIDEISRMKKMLEEMLALTKLEHLPLEFLTKKCEPSKEIMTALSNFQLIHPEFEVNLENQLSSEVEIQMDPVHYAQALNILLDNAVKYSPDERKGIRITICEREDFIETSVSDKGIGISNEDQNLVFERFFRADKARNHEIGGTGLGLSILSNIVKQYQGTMKVESVLGEGSRFTFKIPKAQ